MTIDVSNQDTANTGDAAVSNTITFVVASSADTITTTQIDDQSFYDNAASGALSIDANSYFSDVSDLLMVFTFTSLIPQGTTPLLKCSATYQYQEEDL